MPKDGSPTREAILNSALATIYAHGYNAATLHKVLQGAGVTKGAFFHHFKSKDDLAAALIRRYLDNEALLLKNLSDRATRLSRDPLQQLIIMIGLMIENIENDGPLSKGCLMASYAFELGGFEEKTQKLARQGFTTWHHAIGGKIAEVMEVHTPRLATSPLELADALLAAFEGGLVISRLDGDAQTIARPLAAFRNYIELLFAAPVTAPSAPVAVPGPA